MHGKRRTRPDRPDRPLSAAAPRRRLRALLDVALNITLASLTAVLVLSVLSLWGETAAQATMPPSLMAVTPGPAPARSRTSRPEPAALTAAPRPAPAEIVMLHPARDPQAGDRLEDLAAAAEVQAVVADPAPAGPTFNGRPIRKVRTLSMLVTAYSPDARSCGIWADGRTATGHSVWTNAMRLVAADTRLLPFGSIVSIPGYHGGQPVPVLDRGGKIKGHRLDVLYPTHEIALRWGAQRLDVDVWEYAD